MVVVQKSQTLPLLTIQFAFAFAAADLDSDIIQVAIHNVVAFYLQEVGIFSRKMNIYKLINLKPSEIIP